MTVFCLSSLLLSISASTHAQVVETAKSADAFVNVIGVNTHIGKTGTPYANYSQVQADLQDLGVRHIRAGISISTDPAYNATYNTALNNLAGVGIHVTGLLDGNWYPVSGPLVASDVIARVKALQPALETVEGPNESDLNTNFHYNGNAYPLGAVNYDKDLYNIIKGSTDTWVKNLPVAIGSNGLASNYDQMQTVGTQPPPNPVAYADYGNIHSYPGGKIASNGIDWCVGYSNHIMNTKPLIGTETGYHNNTKYLGAYLQPGVSERASGFYIPCGIFEQFNRGLIRVMEYEFYDETADPSLLDGNGEQHFGLKRNDGTPKPAYTALKNTIAILSEPGASFTPTALTYTLTAPATVHHTLLQKSNGDYYMVLWNNVSCYQSATSTTAGADIINAPVQCTLSFNGIRTTSVYSPSDSSGIAVTGAYTVSRTASAITLNVPDHVVIVKLQSGVNTGFETAEVQTTWSNSIDSSANVTGYLAGGSPECALRINEIPHAGSNSLMYSGSATGGNAACIYKVFDLVAAPLLVKPTSKLSFWIYPQQDYGRYVTIDLRFTNGTTLRDSGALDTNGVSIHPAAGHGGTIPLNQWTLIQCNIGQYVAGRSIDRIWVDFNRGNATGQYRGYIDDIWLTGF